MTTERATSWQGMNWIRPEKRLAIYARDGYACVYCGVGVEDEVKLSLDHVRPYSKGGSNDAENLVTCCKRCNDSRGNRALRVFCKAVAAYIGKPQEAAAIEKFVRTTTRRKLNVAAAKAMIQQRGGFTQALREAA